MPDRTDTPTGRRYGTARLTEGSLSVSIGEDLRRQVDELAAELRISRSTVARTAMQCGMAAAARKLRTER